MLYGLSNPHGGDIYGGGVTLDFSANTNPYGTPEGVLNAVKAALPETRVAVVAECSAGVTPESHENALKAMEACQIKVMR